MSWPYRSIWRTTASPGFSLSKPWRNSAKFVNSRSVQTMDHVPCLERNLSRARFHRFRGDNHAVGILRSGNE